MKEVDTLEQDVQNTDTEALENTDTELEETVDEEVSTEDSNTEDNLEDSEEEDDDDDSSPLTVEQLDAMSDEEFTEFLNTGKISTKETSKDKAKIISKPPKTNDADTAVSKKTQTTDSVDYESAYKMIFKPFKANGKEITPRTVDDVISLMQMGANYTKKMQLMAPMKRAMQSLDKANIKEEDLNFLIDVHNGDVEAIKKLLQKHSVDPFELDLDTTNYVPRNNIASDSEVEFSDTLRDIQVSLPRIQSILTDTWDAQSKQLVLADPNLMRALHEEIEMGRFDEVQNRLEQEKMFGRYKGVADVNAYIDLVNKMVTEAKPTVPKQEKPVSDTKTLNKAKAAPVRSKPKHQGTTLTVKDLYSMSDEEFEKLSMRDLV